MKTYRMITLLAVLALILTACGSPATATPAPTAAPAPTNTPQSAAEGTIAISTGEYSPFSGEKIYQNGFVLHVIREAFAREGLQVRYDFLPWERSYQSMLDQDSPYVASAYWYRSTARESVSLYSEPLIEEEVVFFFRKAEPMKSWDTFDDLKGYRIGTSLGLTYTDAFRELIKNGSLSGEEAPDDELNFKKLLAGRIDIFPVSLAVALDLLRGEFTPAEMDQLDYNKKPLTVSTGHLLFSKSNPDGEKYLNIFNSGLKKLIEDGTYDKMYADLLAGKYSK